MAEATFISLQKKTPMVKRSVGSASSTKGLAVPSTPAVKQTSATETVKKSWDLIVRSIRILYMKNREIFKQNESCLKIIKKQESLLRLNVRDFYEIVYFLVKILDIETYKTLPLIVSVVCNRKDQSSCLRRIVTLVNELNVKYFSGRLPKPLASQLAFPNGSDLRTVRFIRTLIELCIAKCWGEVPYILPPPPTKAKKMKYPQRVVVQSLYGQMIKERVQWNDWKTKQTVKCDKEFEENITKLKNKIDVIKSSNEELKKELHNLKGVYSLEEYDKALDETKQDFIEHISTLQQYTSTANTFIHTLEKLNNPNILDGNDLQPESEHPVNLKDFLESSSNQIKTLTKSFPGIEKFISLEKPLMELQEAASTQINSCRQLLDALDCGKPEKSLEDNYTLKRTISVELNHFVSNLNFFVDEIF